MEQDTLCIHGGTTGTDTSGAIAVPIYQTATFAHPAPGESTGYDYTRDTNPTRDALEAAMAKLDDGAAALAFTSGMAAAAAIMELFSPGEHIIATDDLYGGTFRLFARIYEKNGAASTPHRSCEKSVCCSFSFGDESVLSFPVSQAQSDNSKAAADNRDERRTFLTSAKIRRAPCKSARFLL